MNARAKRTHKTIRRRRLMGMIPEIVPKDLAQQLLSK